VTTSRNMLHIDKLADFKAWLIEHGWREVKTNGDWEVLRMRHDNHLHPLIVYTSSHATEHYTTHGIAFTMCTLWLRDRKNAV